SRRWLVKAASLPASISSTSPVHRQQTPLRRPPKDIQDKQQCPLYPQKRTFKGCWDMIDGMPGKVLNLVEHHHETSPPQILGFSRECRRAVVHLSPHLGTILSRSPSAPYRRCRPWQRP